ncbi:MAG: TonB-dependent receptor [Opitutaceae bacterium]|nr:TonB-dependent receptor [Opitutaceae bacterium]
MTYPSLPGRTVVRKLRGLLLAAVGIAAITLSASAAEAPKKSFDLPAADAAETLKAFTAQSGEQIIYPVENVRGVKTNAVKGEHAAREALDLMLAGTGLTIVQDAGTGALAVRRETDPNDQRATPDATARRQDPSETDGEIKLVKLEAIQVLGTRIRQTEAMGPSPVSTYDNDYIRSTGALTLADFLNYLPQNYTGIGAGRGSAPNELNPEFGQRTESTTPLFDFVMGSSAAPPGQTGVSGVSLRGLGSGSTLVLVDGRRVAQSGGGNRSTTSQQGFVDLNTIPFGMIERIEIITDGASAIYGADAVAGVVNIVLKKNWVGNELSGAFKGAEHGGGRERQVSLTSGFAAGKLRGTVNVSYYDRASLKASQRAFSKNQNHSGIIAGYSATGTPIYGRDLTLLWGYPAVVQARTGNLNGVTYNGAPTRWATVNPGTTDGSSLASYTGAGAGQTGGASYIRRANTAEFLDIIPTSERYSFSGNFTYAFSNRLEAYGDYSYTDTRGLYNTQPAVSSASTSTGFGNFATVVPAAYNPFGQDVIVGLVHYEFGSIRQWTKTQAHRATAGIRGEFGQTWQWDTGVSRQWQDFAQITRTFNGARITAALNNTDAAQRLNPFVDARVASTQNAAIYETMALYPTLNTESQLVTWDFDANGELFDIWGGPVRMAFGGSASRSKNESLAVNYSTAVTPVVSTSAVAGESDSRAAFAEVSVPLFGRPNALPGLQRLELQLASRYEDYDRAGDTTVPKIGVSWVPWQPVLFRASFSEGFRAPALTEYQVANTVSNNNTLTDPRRTPASTTGITISRGASTFIEP